MRHIGQTKRRLQQSKKAGGKDGIANSDITNGYIIELLFDKNHYPPNSIFEECIAPAYAHPDHPWTNALRP
jgi:hypothetical protein